jgi:activator of 2-hydroxyglutaryl-CoA dehydratase/predicted nucleotide-binding protein (sugar kinase/HSP70/actin superfamily)
MEISMKATHSRSIGIDIGAETVKLVELLHGSSGTRIGRREMLEHGKRPGPVLLEALRRWEWHSADAAAVTGRFASQIDLPRVPSKQSQLRGFRYHFGKEPATIVNIGSHGFSVLELRPGGQVVLRENSRCSQGTGNFLRQLVERFSLTVEEASTLCADVAKPASLSGRCPVILKTDMTHLANKGEDRSRILAGLFDAVCENVMVLIKPGVSPNRVLLTGGVSRSPRVRRVFGESLARQGMQLLSLAEEDGLCLEALGSALVAAESQMELPALEELVLPPRELQLERLPALSDSLTEVRRMPVRPSPKLNGELRRLVLGFDIGSTGSKLVAMDVATQETVWEGYRQTLGDPVGAAQDLLRRFTIGPAAHCMVAAFGATGSGREVAGSLLTSCYGKQAVFIVNEIVAHATGALHYDPSVDTIFEIGGQDAKYIRLAEGRIIDCAMNEACSAGTGSFIEEQGRKFAGIDDVRQLGRSALTARSGVSLGQHCSVFMAEVIDEAVAAGIEQSAIISGLYDSIIKNYLNRVKGNRSVGKVIFCQGMPFAADALAAAVARQTGSKVIVPPNPGTVGALGIALLASRELVVERASRPFAGQCRSDEFRTSNRTGETPVPLPPLDPSRFLDARVEQKDTFVCRSNCGCGGAGNRCRIERLRTLMNSQRSNFTWGGGCSLHDKGTRKRKLPDLSPDPFREREELMQRIIAPFIESGARAVSACSTSGRCESPPAHPRIAMSDEFMLKGLSPFFAAFFHEAGFDLEIISDADHATLKRGIQSANVPFCAPMQLFHGLSERMAAAKTDWVFIPTLRSVPRAKGQRCSIVCPIVQSAPDVVRRTVNGRAASGFSRSADFQSVYPESIRGWSRNCIRQSGGARTTESGFQTRDTAEFNSALRQSRLLSPIIDFGEGELESEEFLASCRRLAKDVGMDSKKCRKAWHAGVAAQKEFDAECLRIGRRALEFCREQDIVPVVVLGRGYTIYNKALNSNVPTILREQGAIGIPVDCYPVDENVPVFEDIYWGYGQSLLRAAHCVRRTPGVYSIYCSNYSCGPDSFNLHFAAYVMEGKPFAIIETDGHSGDAGTKTRVEAFLHCVEEDRRTANNPSSALTLTLSPGEREQRACVENSQRFQSPTSDVRRSEKGDSVMHGIGERFSLSLRERDGVRVNVASTQKLNDFTVAQFSGLRLNNVCRNNGASETMLVPYIGPASEAVTAIFRGRGLRVETLSAPDAESLRLGRRYTSGKECLPMPLTLGSLLQRLERATKSERFVYLMPSTEGPCRFGVYNLLNQIVLERLGWRDRVRIWSPKDTGYFEDMPLGTEMLLLAALTASDFLLQALFDVRPVERQCGATQSLYEKCKRELLALLESAAGGDLSLASALWHVVSGNLFGVPELLRRAGAQFAALRGPGERPLIELAGEIYVRSVDFSNDFIIEKLEARGLRVHLAPKTEWVNYCSYVREQDKGSSRIANRLGDLVRRRIEAVLFAAIAPHLDWHAMPSTRELLSAAQPYVSEALRGEAVLTVGAPVYEWRRGQIDAMVNVGPLECMPTKIAEAQLHHVAEREGLLSLTLAFNGDPINTSALDNFAFEVKSRFQRRGETKPASVVTRRENFITCPGL